MSKQHIVMDFRSDTVTKPTSDMLQAMLTAEVGDDVYNDDPSVHQLEKRVAKLCGKEAGLFVCSGVMSNQLALRCHLSPMQEVICDHRSHIYRSEQGGISFHSQCSVMPIIPQDGKTHITAKQVEQKICTSVDYHTPITRVISLENTLHGTVMPIEEIRAISTLAKKHKLIMHLDGARIWNASIATGISLEEYCSHFDSISLCMSKGMGAPIGSVLVGDSEFIGLARRYRKLLGGGWRQAGILAAAANYSIDHIWPLMKLDHENTRYLVDGLFEMGFSTTVPVETNFVFLDGTKLGFNFQYASQFLRQAGIMFSPNVSNIYATRLAIHHQITRDHINTFLSVIRKLLETRYVYRAMSKASFEQDTHDQVYEPKKELEGGFIHFSTGPHIERTVELYCSSINDLLLIKVDAHKLGKDTLVWEGATSDRGGDLFPHLYSTLPVEAIVDRYEIPKTSDKHGPFPKLE